jgi:hypothetical protein
MESEITISFRREQSNTAIEGYIQSILKDNISESSFEVLDDEEVTECLDVLLDNYSGDFYNIESFEINEDKVHLFFIQGADGACFTEDLFDLLRMSGAKSLKGECRLDEEVFEFE